jgi:hypothetical protein
MPDLTIVIRDTDVELLDQLAERDWRDREHEASALLEATLAAARARSTASARSPRGPRRPTVPARSSNGAVRAEA